MPRRFVNLTKRSAFATHDSHISFTCAIEKGISFLQLHFVALVTKLDKTVAGTGKKSVYGLCPADSSTLSEIENGRGRM